MSMTMFERDLQKLAEQHNATMRLLNDARTEIKKLKDLSGALTRAVDDVLTRLERVEAVAQHTQEQVSAHVNDHSSHWG